MMTMDANAEWELVMQYVCEPLFDSPPLERIDKTFLSAQIPTPPVSRAMLTGYGAYSHVCCLITRAERVARSCLTWARQ